MAVIWICAGTILFSLAVILKVDVNTLKVGMVIVDVTFFLGMLVHAFRTASRVPALINQTQRELP